jgi:hypothetical protein
VNYVRSRRASRIDASEVSMATRLPYDDCLRILNELVDAALLQGCVETASGSGITPRHFYECTQDGLASMSKLFTQPDSRRDETAGANASHSSSAIHTSRYRRYRIATTGVAMLLAVISGALAVLADGRHGPPVVFLFFGALAAVANAGLTFMVQGPSSRIAARLRSRKARGTSTQEALFQASLLPVSQGLATLISGTSEASVLRQKISCMLVETAAQLSGDLPSLAAFYALEEDPRGSSRLVRKAVSAETEGLQDSYRESSEWGSYLLSIANSSTPRYVHNLSNDPDAWRIELGSGYESAILAPVRAGHIPIGVLILQSRDSRGISDDSKKDRIRIIAHLLGTCEATADLMAQTSNPSSPGRRDEGGSQFVRSRRRSD